jgi:hypothetical protein
LPLSSGKTRVKKVSTCLFALFRKGFVFPVSAILKLFLGFASEAELYSNKIEQERGREANAFRTASGRAAEESLPLKAQTTTRQ